MNNIDHYEDELDAIRIKLYEQIKDMSSDEQAEFFNTRAQKTADRCGFKLINDVSEATYPYLKKVATPLANRA